MDSASRVRPARKLCIPVRVAHAEGAAYLWAELDTAAGGNAYMGFETLKRLFPYHDLAYETLPGAGEMYGKAHGASNGKNVQYRELVLHYKFGKHQPILRIETVIFKEWTNGGVLVGYPAMKKLGLVLDPLSGGVKAANGEDLEDLVLPSVPAGPLSKEEMDKAIETKELDGWCDGTFTDWRVYFPLDVIGDVEYHVARDTRHGRQWRRLVAHCLVHAQRVLPA